MTDDLPEKRDTRGRPRTTARPFVTVRAHKRERDASEETHCQRLTARGQPLGNQVFMQFV
jgi:hypothetical protein